MHGAFLASQLDGTQQAGDFRLAGIGGCRERDERAKSPLKLGGSGRRGTPGGEFEIDDIAQGEGERQGFGEAHQIVGVGEIALERERRAPADRYPDGMTGGHGLSSGEDGGALVRRGRGGDQRGRPEQCDIGRDVGRAGYRAAGDGQQFGAGGRNQESVGAAEGLEKGGRGGGKFGVERRGTESIEIHAGEGDRR